MAVIVQTSNAVDQKAAVTLTRTTLTASDTLTHVPGGNQTIVLINPTASIVTATFTGTAPETLYPDGFGGPVSTAGGKAVAVPANGAVMVGLDDIKAFLAGSGAVTVTGGTGLFAVLYT